MNNKSIEYKISLWNQLQSMVVNTENRTHSMLSFGTIISTVLALVTLLFGTGNTNSDKLFTCAYALVPLILLLAMFLAAFNNKYSALMRGYLAGLEEHINEEIGEEIFIWNKGYSELCHGRYFLTNDSIGFLYGIIVILLPVFCFGSLLLKFKYPILIGIYILVYVVFSLVFLRDLMTNGNAKKYAKIYFYLYNNDDIKLHQEFPQSDIKKLLKNKLELKEQICNIRNEHNVGKDEKLTGYPSIDKPWLRYYSEEAIHTDMPHMSIYEYLYKCNKEYMDNYALSYYGNRITFKEMFEKIDAIAEIFLSVGVKTGEIVTVCSVNVPETVYVLYGLNKIGAIANMVDPRTSQEGLLKYVDEVKSKIVVTIDVAYKKFEPILSKLEKIMIVSPSDSLRGYKRIGYKLINRGKRIANEKVVYIGKLLNTYKTTGNIDSYYESHQCCVIEHTGGTTGLPKGVMLSNENINAVVLQSVLTGIDMRREHNWLDIMPPFIAYGVGMGLHLPLTIGMETILIPKFDAKRFDELLVKYKPIHMVGVPSYWGTVIDSEKLKKADLSYVIAPTVGGDSMDISLEKRANEFLKEHNCSYGITKGYGMTEVAGGVTGTIDSCNKLGSVGIPFVHSVVSVFEPNTDKELTYMQQGEICICGPNVMLGYYDNEDETKQIIKIHKDGKRWVHTGDLGYMEENGSIYILGRAKRLIIRYDGFKVFPTLIENAVMELGIIKECCVVGKRDEEHAQGMLPIIYAVKKDDCLSVGKVTDEEMVDKVFNICKEKLPEYAQPVECRFIDELPLTPVGKVDYRRLEAETE